MAGSYFPSDHVRTNPSQITSEDLAAVVAVHTRVRKKFDLLGSAALLAGILGGWILIAIGHGLGWLDDWDPMFFFGGWAIGLAGMGLASWRGRRELAGLQLRCAFCAEPLLSGGNRRQAISRAQIVVATGVCPTCGHEFVGEIRQ
jgi:hypothetical protein